ncbi:cell wall-active antibiotics response protein LiaF [Bacillus kwashiorkori]|uniref:cell wall-active antibiotics response protein LiaF n=1 Tax=Bacillus kwashiorkori TaxID=1522318 RepID=UPI000783CE6C|nr:cell wall-active antibiotics response protein LiaF [Bacillus kwashiorkori]
MKLSSSQFLLAIILLLVGGILLLFNIGIISLEIKSIFTQIYPYLFLVYGIYMLVRGIIEKYKNHIFWGSFVVLYSILLIFSKLGKLDFGFWDFWKLWPLLFIFFAIGILFPQKKVIKMTKVKNDDFGFNMDFSYDNDKNGGQNSRSDSIKMSELDELLNEISEKINDENIEKLIRNTIGEKLNSKEKTTYKKSNKTFHQASSKKTAQTNVNVFGLKVADVEYNQSNWSLEPLTLNNTVGNYYIDLSKAFIPEGETPIKIKGRIGDVQILVPEDIAVKIEARNSVGDMTIFGNSSDQFGKGSYLSFKSEDYEYALRKVDINIQLSIGSIYIDYV